VKTPSHRSGRLTSERFRVRPVWYSASDDSSASQRLALYDVQSSQSFLNLVELVNAAARTNCHWLKHTSLLMSLHLAATSLPLMIAAGANNLPRPFWPVTTCAAEPNLSFWSVLDWLKEFLHVGVSSCRAAAVSENPTSRASC
jgi:hypothetical protein